MRETSLCIQCDPLKPPSSHPHQRGWHQEPASPSPHVPSEWLERIWRCGPNRLALGHIEREPSKAQTLFNWSATLEVQMSVETYKGSCFLAFLKREPKPFIVRPKLASHPRNPPSMASSSNMNRYWIPHLDIHKKVITQELQYYLGPEATVRPFTREVRHPPPCHPGSWLTKIVLGRRRVFDIDTRALSDRCETSRKMPEQR